MTHLPTYIDVLSILYVYLYLVNLNPLLEIIDELHHEIVGKCKSVR